MIANDRVRAPQGKATHGRGRSVTRLAVILGAMAFSSSAFAAGIDSRTYTCTNLHGLIAAQGFVFISAPAFGDFVVANISYCNREGYIQLRSVPTTDNPECLVNYCMPSHSSGAN